MLAALKKFVSTDEGTAYRPKLNTLASKYEHMTPDIVELQNTALNFVFVPDECMMLMPKHALVSKTNFYPFCTAYTSEPFLFLQKDLGKESHPVALRDPSIEVKNELPPWMAQALRIRGEIFGLSGSDFIDLDKHKLNGVQFDRVRVKVNVPYIKRYSHTETSENGVVQISYSSSKDMLTSIDAWMYVGKPEFWLPQLTAEDSFYRFSQAPISEAPEGRIWIRKYYDYKQSY